MSQTGHILASSNIEGTTLCTALYEDEQMSAFIVTSQTALTNGGAGFVRTIFEYEGKTDFPQEIDRQWFGKTVRFGPRAGTG